MWCALLREPREHKYSCADLAHGVFDFIFACWPGSSELSGKNYPLLSCTERIRQRVKKKEKNLSMVYQALLSKAPRWNMLQVACALLSWVHRDLLGCVISAGLHGILLKFLINLGALKTSHFFGFGCLSIKLPKFLNLRSYRGSLLYLLLSLF